MSIISENAVLWGTRNSLVVISGNSTVRGNAKILTGTQISGESEVYGDVSLKDSILSGTAKVCQSYQLDGVQSDNDYYCMSEDQESDIEISISNIDAESFNPMPKFIKIRSKDVKFKVDPNVYIIHLNNKLVDPSKINITRSEISLDIRNDLIDGYNSISLHGRDEFDKIIDEPDVNFITGSSSKVILIDFELVNDSTIKFKVKYTYEGQEFKGTATYSNNLLTLRNVPLDLYKYSIELSGIGNDTMVFENFKSLDLIPSSLLAYQLPKFVNNSDFDDDLASWRISHPENVSIETTSGTKQISVLGNDNERVELSKRFYLNSGDAGLSLETVLPGLSSLLTEDDPLIEIVILSLKTKTYFSHRYVIHGQTPLTKTNSFINEFDGGEFAIYVRLNPSVSLKYPVEPLKILSASKKDFILKFSPYHLNVKNRKTNTLISVKDPDCSKKDYEVGNKFNDFNTGAYPHDPHDRMIDNSFKYFSAGNVWYMQPQVIVNKMHATFKLVIKKPGNMPDTGPEFAIVDNPTLLISQNGQVKKEIAVSKCAAYELNQLSFKNEFKENKNVVKHLFEITFDIAPYLDLTPGSKVSLYLKAFVSNGHETFPKLSDPIDVPILVALPVDRSHWFGQVSPSGLDHYDNPTQGMLRTGGDKWILPFYSNIVTNLLTTTGWKVNDFSKLNGGHFPGHKSHNDGLNGDLSIDGFDFLANTNNVQWENILKKIETFLVAIENNFYMIDTFFVTRDAEHKPLKSIPIDTKLSYRCLGTNERYRRYISFHNGDKEKSLLKNSTGHNDHLHIRFNNVFSNGTPEHNDSEPVDYDLDDAWFEIVKIPGPNAPTTYLKISPKNIAEAPPGLRILWRYQSSLDFLVGDEVLFGRWPFLENYSFNPSMKHLYVAFVDTNSGNCVQRYVDLDINPLKPSSKWSYKKKNDLYFMKEYK